MVVFTHHDTDDLVWITSVDKSCIIEKLLGRRSEQRVDAVFDRASEHLHTCLCTRTHMSTHVSSVHVYTHVCGQAYDFVYAHVYASIEKVAHVSCKLQ